MASLPLPTITVPGGPSDTAASHGAPVQVPAKAPSLGRMVLQLSKLRLSLLVVFSGTIAFAIGRDGAASLLEWILFVLAGLSTTVSANIINQILERDVDSLMHRTRNRPLPMGFLSTKPAWALVFVFGAIGMGIYLFAFTALSFWLALASWVLYGFVYTPLKKITPLAVAVGALPGALPLLIGFAAATGVVGPEAILMFVVQFIWQFPHFWSLAWVLADDYARGGFRLLPTKGNNPNALTAVLMFLYTTLLLPASWLPFFLEYVSLRAAVVCTLAGLLFMYPGLKLMIRQDIAAARGVMFGSFLYLPVVQLTVLLDKLL